MLLPKGLSKNTQCPTAMNVEWTLGPGEEGPGSLEGCFQVDLEAKSKSWVD